MGASKRYGGAEKKGTPGRQPLIPGPATVRVAHIVQVVGFGRVKMIWRLKGQT